MEEGRHSCKCTNDNTDSIVQARRLDKPEKSLMQVSHVPKLHLSSCTQKVICSRVAVAEDKSKLGAELSVVSLYHRGVAWEQFTPKRFPNDSHLFASAQRRGTSGDRGFQVTTCGLATSTGNLRRCQCERRTIRVPGRVVHEIGVLASL